MRSLIFIALLSFTFVSFSQLVNLPGVFDAPLRETIEGKQVSGERYFLPNYKSGFIYDNTGKEYAVFLKYDLYKDEVEVFNDNKALVLTKAMYPRFKYEYFDDLKNAKEVIEFRSGFVIEGYTRLNYFQIMIEDEEALLIKSNKVVLEEFTQSDYGGKNQVFNKYVNKPRYFLYFGENNSQEIRNTKAGVLEAFGDKKEEISAFIKQNKLKFKSEWDLQQAVTYYLQINS